MSLTNQPPKEVHRNVPQLMFQICMSQLNVCLWSRATGKSEGPMADFFIENIFAMPRSNGFIMGTSYSQILTRTLPPLVSAWEEFYGLKEDKHYWVRKYAPEKLQRPKAYRHPADPKNYIPWYNGTGLYLVSQDRPGTINGIRSQFGGIDEARFINKQRFDDEVIPTMAGLNAKFGHLWNYLSLLFCSDMPRNTKGKWLLDLKREMENDVIESIIHVHSQMQKLRDDFLSGTEAQQKRLRPKIAKLYHLLNELRKGTTYFSKANILDNIDALGLEPLKHFRRVLSDIDFAISIMNKEMFKIENGYYSLLNEDDHGYTAPNIQLMDELEYNPLDPPVADCTWEMDIIPGEDLHIGCDYNNEINCVVTAQHTAREFRALSSLYVKDDELLLDCVKKWNAFYKNKPGEKVVHYWYDATAIGGTAATDISFSDMWVSELQRLGWIVVKHDIGQIGSHHSRHHFYKLLFSGRDARLPKFRYNKTNCETWATAAQQTDIIQMGDLIKKDKSSEKANSGIPPEEATHITEAMDVIVWGLLRPLVGDEGEFIDMFS